MKIHVLTVAGILLAACSANNVKISGEIASAVKQSVYLEQLNVAGPVVVDSTKISSDGTFSFKANLSEPTLYSVRFANKQAVTLMLKPEETVSVKADYADLAYGYTVEGSDGSVLIREHSKHLNQTQKQLDSLRSEYMKAEDEALRNDISSQYDTIYNRQLAYSRSFILEHAINPAMYYVLYQKLNDMPLFQTPQEIQSYRVVASSMKAIYPNSQYTQSLLKHYDVIMHQLKSYHIQNIIQDADKVLPEISLPNVNGDTISLQSLQGKYVLLDFTVLGVKENMEHMKDLKRVYDKYKNRGLVIYQVCLDTQEEMWKQLVRRMGVEWMCVYDAASLNSVNAAQWNVQSVPSNYLINKELDIVGKNLFGRRLDDRMADVIK